MNTKEEIISILDNLGIYIDILNDEDIDLREYILDSIQFISFIVELEKKFCIFFPDEMLSVDVLSSLNSFSILVDTLISEKENEKV